MKKAFTFLLIVLFCGPSFSQVIKSFTHESGYGLSATSTSLLKNGYVVASKYSNGFSTVNYLTRYRQDGSVSWTKTENSGILSGIADITENNRQEMYLLSEDVYRNGFYGLTKTDSAGNVLWSRNLSKKAFSAYDAPRVKVNQFDDVYVMSSTFEKTNIYKLDDNGNLLWSKTIAVDTSMSKNPAFDMITTKDGGIIYAGKAENEVYIERLTATGSVVWTKQLFDNSNALSLPKAMVGTQDGNVVIAGYRTETSGAMLSGMFLMKLDENGILHDYKLYYDNDGRYGFTPRAIYETTNGNLKVMGCGPVLTIADVDASLKLEKYSVWNTVGNFEAGANCFHYQNDQLLVTGTENNTTQYILRNAEGLGDFCGQEEITTMTSTDLAINNDLYVAHSAVTNGPTADAANYTWSNDADFTTTTVCGQSELTLGTKEISGPTGTINVYPNPVSGGQVLNLDLSWDDETIIVMMNAEGRPVLEQRSTGYHPQLDTGGLPAGMYFLSAQVKGKNITTKIVVY